MAWATPQFSRARVDAAGKFLTDPMAAPAGQLQQQYDEALTIVNNWRASHGLPLQIIKMTLLKRARGVDERALIAQRTKRIPAIELKLRANGNMQLSQMHDRFHLMSKSPSCCGVRMFGRPFGTLSILLILSKKSLRLCVSALNSPAYPVQK
jgi:hypothetical protein